MTLPNTPQIAHDAPDRKPQASPFSTGYRPIDNPDSPAYKAANLLEGKKPSFLPNPATAYRLVKGWNKAIGCIQWRFTASNTTIAVLDEADYSHDKFIAQLKAWYPFLDKWQRDECHEIYPRIEVRWIESKLRPSQVRYVKSLRQLDLSGDDQRGVDVQTLKWAAIDAGMDDRQIFDLYQKHYNGSADRAAAFKVAMEAIESMSKPKPQGDYVSPSVAISDTPMFAVKNASELDAAFPRDANNQPVEEQPEVDELTGKSETEQPKHWIDVPEKRAHTFAYIKDLFDGRGAPVGEWRKEWLASKVNATREVESSHIHDYPGAWAEWHDEAANIMHKYDDAKSEMREALESAGLKADAPTWQKIFNHERFWDTVASGLDKWQIKVKVHEFILAQKNAQQVTQAASTPVAPPPVADVSQAPESKPAVNGAGQSSPAVKDVIEADIIAETPAPQLPAIVAPTEIAIFDAKRSIAYVRSAHDLIVTMIKDKILVEASKDENGNEIEGDYGKAFGSKKPALYKSGAEKLCEAFGLVPKFPVMSDSISDWKEPFFYFHYTCELYRISDGKLVATANGSCNSREDKYGYRWVELDKVPAKYRAQIAELESRPNRIRAFDFAIKEAKTEGDFSRPAEYWKMFQDAIAAGRATSVDMSTKNGKKPGWEIDGSTYRIPNNDIFSIVNTLDKMAQKRALVAAVLIGTAASRFFTQDVEDMPEFGMIA